jgi:hypothetical protein
LGVSVVSKGVPLALSQGSSPGELGRLGLAIGSDDKGLLPLS